MNALGGALSAQRGTCFRIARARLDDRLSEQRARNTGCQTPEAFPYVERRRIRCLSTSSTKGAATLSTPGSVSSLRYAGAPDGWGPSVPLANNASAGLVLSDEARTERLLLAVRTGDTTTAYGTLTALIPEGSPPSIALTQAISKLPQTAYSELLQCLDPKVVAKTLDTVNGIVVNAGMAMHTALGHTVDRFGIKIVFAKLLRILTILLKIREDSGRPVLMADHLVLIRCCGATSRGKTAHKVWQKIDSGNNTSWRQSAAYHEFVAARFLTEDMYYGHDIDRVRVRPRNLHRTGKWRLASNSVERLDAVRRSKELRATHRHGQNPEILSFAEPLTRLLRGRQPVQRLYKSMLLSSNIHEEGLLCAFLVAFARTGSFESIKRLMSAHWGIRIDPEKDTRLYQVSGGNDFAVDSPMKPSIRLLEAIVHAFCCTSEPLLAKRLVEHVSLRYNIVAPPRIWSSLFEWTALLGRDTNVHEWKISRLHRLIPSNDAVERLWTTLINDPKYDFRPTVTTYGLYIRNLLQRGRRGRALQAMQILLRAYEDQCRQIGALWSEAVQCTAQHVRVTDLTAKSNAALAQRSALWHDLHAQCRQFLSGVRSNQLDSAITSKIVPDLVERFAEFMPLQISYRTATGYVSIKSDNPALKQHSPGQFEEGPELGFKPLMAEHIMISDGTGTLPPGIDAVLPANLPHTKSVFYRRRKARRRVVTLRTPGRSPFLGKTPTADRLSRALLSMRTSE